METIGCKDFLHRLDSWLEGEPHPDARAHLRYCSRCRNVLADIDAIRSSALALAVCDEEPPARIWTSLRAQLEQEGLIRHPSELWPGRFQTWLDARMPRPVLASAYLAILVAAAFGLAGQESLRVNDNNWIRNTQSFTLPLSAQLATAEEKTVSNFGDSKSLVAASLHQNLAIVDTYIDLCEKSAREDPSNEMVRDYLYQAYQQKADLLAQMTDRGESR